MITISRRTLVRALGLSAGAAAFAPSLSLAAMPTDRRFVLILLRGGMDGLSAVPPHGDPGYAALRNRTRIAPPGGPEGALKLDATFGLHPALAGLHGLYQSGELAVFPAISSPYRERSHFDGQDVLESGALRPREITDGWMNRALAAYPRKDANRALAVSQAMPLIMLGTEAVSSWTPPTLPAADQDFFARIQRMYEAEPGLAKALEEALATRSMAQGAMDGQRMGGGNPLNQTATLTRAAGALLRAEEGARLAVIDPGGWDTHNNQGGAQGQLAQRLADLDRGLVALKDSLGAAWAKTAVVVVTEFGRTAAENGSAGTDHGTGGAAFLLGGSVKGGRLVGDWPGLAAPKLYQGRDLMPTLDMRGLFKAVLGDHLGFDMGFLNTKVFPNSAGAAPLAGLFRA